MIILCAYFSELTSRKLRNGTDPVESSRNAKQWKTNEGRNEITSGWISLATRFNLRRRSPHCVLMNWQLSLYVVLGFSKLIKIMIICTWKVRFMEFRVSTSVNRCSSDGRSVPIRHLMQLERDYVLNYKISWLENTKFCNKKLKCWEKRFKVVKKWAKVWNRRRHKQFKIRDGQYRCQMICLIFDRY